MSKRQAPREISRELISSREVQTRYLFDNVEVTVKSMFAGNESIEDLFFDIITRKFTNNESAVLYYKDSQPAVSVPLIGGNSI